MLNWLSRYAFLRDELRFTDNGALTESVLDVGCGPHGLSVIAPEAEFVGVDTSFPSTVAPHMLALRNSPGRLPFKDCAFDTVICLDVLEHIPRPERPYFVQELARVSAERVFLACPSSEAQWLDDLAARIFKDQGRPAPDWLNEHYQHVLPSPEEISGFCDAVAGFSSREILITNGLLATLSVIGDIHPDTAKYSAREYATERQGWIETFASARFGSCYRKAHLLTRSQARHALISQGAFADSVFAATACPGCREFGLGGARPGARCAECGTQLVRDESGAYDVTNSGRRSGPASKTAAGSARKLEVLLAPDWSKPRTWLPQLSHYLAHAPVDGSTLLHLDVSGAPFPASIAVDIIQLACEALTDGRPFADISVIDDADMASSATRVASFSEIDRILEARPDPVVVDDATAWKQILAVKQLADSITKQIDQWRFSVAPDPWSDREPLVSVRIPTWKGREVLMERTLPSVLASTYSNFEIVVCSDGPEPATKAAVESLADSRVRHVQVPKRRNYPAQPWSFWLTAGIHAMNHGLDECRGAFIAPLDHDDSFTSDHIEVLLAEAARTKADMVYGQAMMERFDRSWSIVGSAPLRRAQITHGSVLYNSRLRQVRMDPDCWMVHEPGDWNMWRRFGELTPRISFLPRPVLMHFREFSSLGAEETGAAGIERFSKPSEGLSDLRLTGSDWMLDVVSSI